MLTRPGPLPRGPGWAFEVKWDGFRALVSSEDGFAVRSRRGWNMTGLVPELRELPAGLVVDGELVAFKGGEPWFPLVGRRLLNGDRSIPVRLMIFDVLRVNGEDLTEQSFRERRERLRWLDLDGPCWTTTEVFDDGQALYEAVCERGLEGVVAKWRKGRYTPGGRGWVKTKNPGYWRRDLEIEGLWRSLERRARALA